MDPRLRVSAERPGAPLWVRLSPLLTVLLWAGNVVVSKEAIDVIHPTAITFYRWIAAFTLLSPFLLPGIWRRRGLVRRHAWHIVVLGTLGMGIYQGLAYEAARTASAVNIGVLLALTPLVSALMTRAFASEPLSVNQFGGALLSIAGLIYLVTHGRPATLLTGGVHIGDLLIFVAMLANALYGVLLRRFELPFTSMQQLYLQVTVGMLIALPFYLAGPMTPVNADNLGVVLYAALPASLLGPFFWITGIRYLGAPRATLYVNLLPLFVALIAWLTIGEQLHAYHALGGITALLGVAWGLRPAGRPPAAVRPANWG